jgi:hypothetical protein
MGQERAKEVVFEIVLDVSPETADHLETCKAPLFCALGLDTNEVAVIGVERGNGGGPVALPGFILRTRVTDADQVKATSDLRTQIAAMTSEAD